MNDHVMSNTSHNSATSISFSNRSSNANISSTGSSGDGVGTSYNNIIRYSSKSSQIHTVLKQSFRLYAKQKLLFLELVLCISFAFVVKELNMHIWKIHERPIPYQILQSSSSSNDSDSTDVILDFSLSEEYKTDVMISASDNYLVCMIVPFLCFLYFGTKASAPLGDLHCILCTFALAFALDSIVCDTMKRYIGRLRPNFYDQCGFDLETLECTEDDYDNARLSFPSGHSHLAFTCMMVLSFYLLGKASCANQKSVGGEDAAMDLKHRIYIILAMTPSLWAFFVGVAVIQDNMHFASDVVAGAIIGSIVATFTYHLWYYPCFSCKAGIPLRLKAYQYELTEGDNRLLPYETFADREVVQFLDDSYRF